MTLEEEFAILSHELGAALSQWARVEHGIYLVTRSCVLPDQYEGLGKGMFSIENLRSRLDFAESLMDTRWAGDERIGRWREALERTRSASTKRNKLVHQVAVSIPTQSEGNRFALQPWVYKTVKFKNRTPQHPPGSIGIRQISEIGAEFAALAFSLENLSDSLAGMKERHSRRAEQSTGLPSWEDIAARIRAALQPPLQSPRH